MGKVVLVDEKDNILGETSREEAHQKGLLHKISVIYLYNDKGEILVQQRADGRLDHSSAGHVDPGETNLQTAKRELEEELGVKRVQLETVGKILNDEIEPNSGDHIRHLDTIYKAKANPVKINKEEIQKVFWAKPRDILEDMHKSPKNIKYTNGFKVALKYLMEKSMKATAIAPANIAFTKYWGKKDEVLRLPENGSISMSLSNLLTITTVEFSPSLKKDQVIINGGGVEEGEAERVIKHLDRIRNLASHLGRGLIAQEGVKLKAKVVSKNNFPIGTGLSSSASGFAALSLAAATAAGLKLSEKDLSILARQGAGSACRSIPGGFVEWLDGNTSDTSYAKQIFPPNYWKIADVAAIVSEGKKEIPSSTGMRLAQSSPFMKLRVSRMKEKNKEVKRLIKEKRFKELGELTEQDALELHSIMLTQYPPLIYWTPGTLQIMKLVPHWRQEGIPVYFTINTGQDIHLICESKNVKKVVSKLKELDFVKDIIINTPGEGTRLSKKHLF